MTPPWWSDSRRSLLPPTGGMVWDGSDPIRDR